MKKQLFLVSIILMFISLSAQAIVNPYLELNAGYSSTGGAKITEVETLTKQSNKYLGWNFNAGLTVLGLGAEIGYTNYADIKYNANAQTAKTSLYGLHLAAVFQHSLGPIFIVTKLGLGQLHQGPFTVNSVSVANKNTTNLYWGLGFGIKPLPSLAATLQYQQIQGNNNIPTANIATLGLRYSL